MKLVDAIRMQGSDRKTEATLSNSGLAMTLVQKILWADYHEIILKLSVPFTHCFQAWPSGMLQLNVVQNIFPPED